MRISFLVRLFLLEDPRSIRVVVAFRYVGSGGGMFSAPPPLFFSRAALRGEGQDDGRAPTQMLD